MLAFSKIRVVEICAEVVIIKHWHLSHLDDPASLVTVNLSMGMYDEIVVG
jgi:hypothetical protein